MSAYIEEEVPEKKPCLGCRGFPGCDEDGCGELARWVEKRQQESEKRRKDRQIY